MQIVHEMQRERKKSMILVDGWVDVQERVSGLRARQMAIA
jgi:hypothetical protein